MLFLLLMLDSEADRALIGELFTCNFYRMKRAALCILHDDAAAEDAVQDTFIRCMQKIDTIRNLPEHARSVYLLTAVRHTSLDRLRKSGAHPSVPIEEVELSDESASVEERVMNHLTVQAVKEAFTRLPESQQDVLRYKYLLELSDGEIAKALGVSKSSVRVYLMRAKKAVLQLCKENGYAE